MVRTLSQCLIIMELFHLRYSNAMILVSYVFVELTLRSEGCFVSFNAIVAFKLIQIKGQQRYIRINLAKFHTQIHTNL